MLWQPALPEAYIRMDGTARAEAIGRRRRQLGDSLVILGHHYQTDAVIRHADVTGDSLKLSQVAAGLAGPGGRREGVLKTVVFCGVHFMAETADMLTPEGVSVVLPDLSAGCSMADMAAYDDTVRAWDDLHEALRAQGWSGRIVPVTYVNSSAAIKAFVGAHGGACCTSSNAMEVVRWALKGGETPGDWPEGHVKVMFLPDQHLGRNTAAKAGVDVARDSVVYEPKRAARGEALGGIAPGEALRSRVILWAGHCSVHKLFRPEHCEQVRARDAAGGTKTTILVHPECCKEVVDRADLAGSTEFIIRTIQGAAPGSAWAVGTETNLVNRIAREAGNRGVTVRMLSECQCLCTTMYRIDEPHLLWALDNLAGEFEGRGGGREGRARVVNRIQVPEVVRRDALLALDRMLELTGGGARLERLVTAD